jgi:hypothetical protein
MKQRCCCGRAGSVDHVDLCCIQALRAMTPGQGSEIKRLPDVPTVLQIFPPSHVMLLKNIFATFHAKRFALCCDFTQRRVVGA